MTKLTIYERRIMRDPGLLLAKVSLMKKIWQILQQTQREIQSLNSQSTFNFPQELNLESGKISRGENYLLLPYLVLDFPSVFSNNDIFSFRTMFWWGHFFSFTLHLQGKFLEEFRPEILKNLTSFNENTTYLSVGATPWEYHYEPDNYRTFANIDSPARHMLTFAKISQKIGLDRWADVESEAVSFWSTCLKVLES